MGIHSGYDRICDVISEHYKLDDVSIYRKNRYLPKNIVKCLNSIVKRVRKSQTYDCNSLLAELAFLKRCVFRRSTDINHILYIERALSLLSHISRHFNFKLIGTSHQPLELWQNGRHDVDILKALDLLIVLSRKEKEFFEKFLPGKVYFVRHGVDTRFFHPKHPDGKDNAKAGDTFRCLYSGTWLRDTESLGRIVRNVISTQKPICFDLLVPAEKRKMSGLNSLSCQENIFWHCNLTDLQLRALIRNSDILVLPLLNCTANNAVLEAIACGVPVISTDVGGIRDYLNPTFTDLFPIGAVDEFCDAIIYYAEHRAECQQRGKLARCHAEDCLSWEKIAQQTMYLYNQL
jgi:glycosyltransferase involved in cell wall biosynthesis